MIDATVAGNLDSRAGDPVETIGDRLRRLRLEQGWSQRDLSDPGISYAYISRIEAGARRPSVKALRMLAKKLGVTPGYLETGSTIGTDDERELKIAEAELRLRLDGEIAAGDVHAILDDAVAHADASVAVRAQIVLGLAAAVAGNHTAAVKHLEPAVSSDLVTPATRPDVYATLGRVYAAAGSPRLAVDLLERGLDELARVAPDDLATRIRFSTYLSYALTDLGELQRARTVVAEVVARSGPATDRYTRVRLYWSLGRVSLEQAQPRAALDNFRRAVALLEATEDSVHLARAHVACADAILTARDDPAGALDHLAEAEWLLQPHPGNDDLAVIRRMQAMRATQAGELVEAERCAQEALELTLELPNEHGQAWWALAEARAGGAAGNTEADDAFRQAISLLGGHGTVRHHANVLRAYGRYLRDAGREGEALDVFERAADVASNLQGEPAATER